MSPTSDGSLHLPRGKEPNRLEEVNAGLVHDPEEVYTAYEDPSHGPWQTLVRPVLKQIPVRRLQGETGMSPSQLKAIGESVTDAEATLLTMSVRGRPSPETAS